MTPPVVLVQAGSGPAWTRSLETLRAHLPADVELVELDGETAAAAAAAAPADVVLVDRPVLVGSGWLQGLEAARDTTVATVSPLVLNGEAPPSARAASEPRHPRMAGEPVACRLVRRTALQLAGPLDAGFAARCSARGMTHVVADDVLALMPGAAGPAPDPADRFGRHVRPVGSLERARLAARRTLEGLTVAVDGRALGASTAGTQVHTLQLIRALHATRALRMRVLLPPDPVESTVRALSVLDDVELVDASAGPRGTPRSQIVHRPYQVTSPEDLLVLRQFGERLVITHQDSILFHAAAYHADHDAWGAYRRLTAEALAAADLTLTFSEHAGRELIAEDLVEPSRLHVVTPGTDHPPEAAAARAPRGSEALGERPFMVCLGTDLRHKNRLFAIELLGEMRARGWDGALLLAGAHVQPGGSAAEERERLEHRPEPVLDLGPVDEAGKTWLYERATAVAYPTLVEGFGFIPFEAAAAGTPSLFAPQASLGELIGTAATLVPWDAAASAERALALIGDPAAAGAQVEAVRAAGAPLTWRATAERLLALYDEVLTLPSAPGAANAWCALEAEDARGAAEGRYWALRDEIGDTGLSLVGDGGTLPEDVERALAALSARRVTREPLFAALRGLQRLASRGRR